MVTLESGKSYHWFNKYFQEWCFENFINQRNMKQVMEVRNQLREICVSKGLKIESCGRETTDLRYVETNISA